MKPLDLLDVFNRTAGDFAYVATFDFDPQFFEQRLMSRKAFADADRILIFMDQTRYQELVQQGILGSGFNRRYLVVPIDRAPLVFHPKLYLTLGDGHAEALVGSNNCTSGGIAYNLELSSIFAVHDEHPTEQDRTARYVIRQVYDAVKSYAADTDLADILLANFFSPAEDKLPWFNADVAFPKGEIELLSSHRAPLWDQVIKRLESQTVRKISIVAPFFDRELGLLKRIRAQWPEASLTLLAQDGYATLSGAALAKLFEGGRNHKLLSANPPPGRRLHAKAFAFETREGTFWLAGSPNATLAALTGKNSETALWFSSCEQADTLFEDGALSVEEIDPLDFQAGAGREPTGETSEEKALSLQTVVLHEQGSLECQFDIRTEVQDLSLRVRNTNEALPVLSLPIRGTQAGKATLELEETQIGQIRAAAVCQLKGSRAGLDVVSNPVALVQLYQLFRERPAKGDPRNPLQRIEESGENLVPYIDGLGSVREAIEFLDHCNIRFYDGEHHGGRHGGIRWKPRDPFKPDTPAQWINIPAGVTSEELRRAIWEFVERHQWDKLYRHVRRGNLNGLPNFLDIFRTLNGLLVAYNHRRISGNVPVMPFAYAVSGIMKNLELVIGPFEVTEQTYEEDGFVASILKNMQGDSAVVYERLREERVPQMLRAAVDVMVDLRMKGRKLPNLDPWAMTRLRWVSEWIAGHGFDLPTAEDVRTAGLEYTPGKIAA